MTKFLVIYKTEEIATEISRNTNELINSHVEHIKNLDNKGILFLCGVFTDNTGAMLIFESESTEEVENYILKDPLIIEKFYSYTIQELIEANKDNNYLMEWWVEIIDKYT